MKKNVPPAAENENKHGAPVIFVELLSLTYTKMAGARGPGEGGNLQKGKGRGLMPPP